MSEVPSFIAENEPPLEQLPDPNGSPNMVGEVLPATFVSTEPEVDDGDR